MPRLFPFGPAAYDYMYSYFFTDCGHSVDVSSVRVVQRDGVHFICTECASDYGVPGAPLSTSNLEILDIAAAELLRRTTAALTTVEDGEWLRTTL